MLSLIVLRSHVTPAAFTLRGSSPFKRDYHPDMSRYRAEIGSDWKLPLD